MAILWQDFFGKDSVTEWCEGEGFERVPGWECLYVNKSKKLFLSIYVDDFKMAGDAQNIAPPCGKDLEKNWSWNHPSAWMEMCT